MRKHYSKNAFLALAAMLAFVAVNGPLAANPSKYESSRALGMGGATVAVADDHQALFCNPAGLALQKQSSYSLINVSAERNDGYDNVSNHIDKLSDKDTPAARSGNFSNLAAIMGEKGYQAWSTMAYYLGATGFGISAIHRESEFYAVENPASPRVNSRIYQDTVLSGSIARDFGETQMLFKDRASGWWGATLKFATRRTGEHTFYARDFAALTPEILADADRTGTAVDFDLGALWQLNNAWQTSIGMFAGNILGSDYSEEAGTMKRQFAIGTSIKPLAGPPERNEKLLLAADYWETGDDRTGLAKVRLGMQLRLSKYLQILAGLRSGYVTGGLAIGWHDLRINIASYGEETGQRPGEREDRRTSVTFNLEF
jgi:hypothetical protein